MIARDLPPAPFPDVLECRMSGWRSATMEVINALLVVAVAAIAVTLWRLLAGEDSLGSAVWASIIQSAIIFPLLVGLGVWLRWREPPFVRLSADGIELAATRTNRVVVPWPAVASVSMRRPGVFAVLYVTVTSSDALSGANVGRGWPVARVRDGACKLRVEAGLLSPGGRELLAETQRRRSVRQRQPGRRRR